MHVINGYNVEVPSDMEVTICRSGPGAMDHISYRGVTIKNYEEDDEPEVYTGPFAVLAEEFEFLDPPRSTTRVV